MEFHIAGADTEWREIDFVNQKHDFEPDGTLLQAPVLGTRNTLHQTSQIATSKEHHLAWSHIDTASKVWERRLLEFIAQTLPTGDYENWAQCQRLLPLIEPFYSTLLASAQSYEPWAWITTKVAWYHWRRGNLEAAHENILIALNIREKLWGAEDERTLYSMEIQVNILIGQGRYDEAESVSRRIHGMLYKFHRSNDSRILTCRSNLALILLYQGRHQESEELSRRTLDESKKLLGQHHTDTLTSVNNLALVLHSQNRCAEAAALHRQALEGFQQQFGPRHPSTLTSMENFARVLQDEGKYAEAKTLQRQSLAQELQPLGAGCSSARTTKRNLVGLPGFSGKSRKASALKQQHLENVRVVCRRLARRAWPSTRFIPDLVRKFYS